MELGHVPFAVQFLMDGTVDPQSTPMWFLWNFGDGTTSTDPNPLHTYTTAGIYTATLTIYDQLSLSTGMII